MLLVVWGTGFEATDWGCKGGEDFVPVGLLRFGRIFLDATPVAVRVISRTGFQLTTR